MEELFDAIRMSFWSAITSPVFLWVLFGILLIATVIFLAEKKKASFKYNDGYEVGLDKDNKEHLQEIEEIKKMMGKGTNKPIEVDAVKALFIARHFEQYNLLASEKGTVVFERLLKVGDTIEATLGNEGKKEEIENQKANFQNIEVLENGDIRLMREGGYTIFKNGLIVGSKIFEEKEEKKKVPAKEERKQNKKNEIMKVANALEEDPFVVAIAKDEYKNSEHVLVAPSPVENKKEEQKNTANILIENPEVINGPENVLKTNELLLEEPKQNNTLNIVHEKTMSNEKTEESWVKQVVDRTKGEQKFSSEEPIIDANNLAAFVKGKEQKEKNQPKKEIKNFEPLYLYENNEDFFRIAFLSEPEEPSFEKKIIRFLSFMIGGDTVLLSEGDKRLYVHIDTVILSFTRTMFKECRETFLKGIYDENGVLNNRAFSIFMQPFSKKIELFFGKTFLMWWKQQQLDFRSCVFPRVIKHQNKVYKGEFVVFNFKELEFAHILSKLNLADMEISGATIIGSSASEFEAISGKKVKVKTMQEILDVL